MNFHTWCSQYYICQLNCPYSVRHVGLSWELSSGGNIPFLSWGSLNKWTFQWTRENSRHAMTCVSWRMCAGGKEKISTIYFNFLAGNEIIICVWSTHRLVYIFSRIEMLQMHLLLIWTACLQDYYGRLMAFTNSQIKTTFSLSQIMEFWCFGLQEPI